jgi:hypothetical protein
MGFASQSQAPDTFTADGTGVLMRMCGAVPDFPASIYRDTPVTRRLHHYLQSHYASFFPQVNQQAFRKFDHRQLSAPL